MEFNEWQKGQDTKIICYNWVLYLCGCWLDGGEFDRCSFSVSFSIGDLFLFSYCLIFDSFETLTLSICSLCIPAWTWVDAWLVWALLDVCILWSYPFSLFVAVRHSFSERLCPANRITTSVTRSSDIPGQDFSTNSNALRSSSIASPLEPWPLPPCRSRNWKK